MRPFARNLAKIGSTSAKNEFFAFGLHYLCAKSDAKVHIII